MRPEREHALSELTEVRGIPKIMILCVLLPLTRDRADFGLCGTWFHSLFWFFSSSTSHRVTGREKQVKPRLAEGEEGTTMPPLLDLTAGL